MAAAAGEADFHRAGAVFGLYGKGVWQTRIRRFAHIREPIRFVYTAPFAMNPDSIRIRSCKRRTIGERAPFGSSPSGLRFIRPNPAGL